MATSTVKSPLHSVFSAWLPAPVLTTLVLTICAFLSASVSANSAAELEVLRVDVPLDRASFKNGELKISTLITDNTYIDIREFNLRAIELEASSTREGEVRLKVGRYVTPPVPLPGPNNEGLLRIEAPHKSNKSWRLLIEDRINITSLTAVLEPRDDDVAHYESRYEKRGYTLSRDDNYRPYSRTRHDNWPYSWLSNSYDYNRRSAHWFWLNDSRSRFHYNPGYGHSHRHTPRCYDRYGRHMSFNASIGRSNRLPRYRNSDRYLNQRRGERNSRDGERVVGPQQPPRQQSPRQQRPIRNPNREPVMRAPDSPRPASPRISSPRISAAQRNQAAQAQLQQRMQQAQRRQQAHSQQQRQQQQRQQQQRQQRRDAREGHGGRAMGPRAAPSARAQRYNRSAVQRGIKGQRQDR